MSLDGRSKPRTDPVATATLKGKAPTLGDVKQSVRVSTLDWISVPMLTYFSGINQASYTCHPDIGASA